jgi:hypothetical protein
MKQGSTLVSILAQKRATKKVHAFGIVADGGV